MTREEVNNASLLVYLTDRSVDKHLADEWSMYEVEGNCLKIKKYFGADYFYMAIYNMDVVEKVVLSI